MALIPQPIEGLGNKQMGFFTGELTTFKDLAENFLLKIMEQLKRSQQVVKLSWVNLESFENIWLNDNWFNKNCDRQLQKEHLGKLQEVSVKNQLLQFDSELYQQIDGVIMGHPAGSLLLANTFICLY